MRKYPELSFEQINQSIDKSMMTYGERIQEIREKIDQTERRPVPASSITLPPSIAERLPKRTVPKRDPIIERYRTKALIDPITENYRAREIPKVDISPQPNNRSFRPAYQRTESSGSMDTGSDFVEPFPEKSENPSNSAPSQSRKFKGSKIARTGIYILPFAGMQISEKYEWGSSAGPIGLQQELGYGGGLRIGKKWTRFFMEAELGYSKNPLDGFEGEVLFPSGLFEAGEATVLNGLLNFGLNLPTGENFGFELGCGIGYGEQEVDLDLGTFAVSEKNAVFSYQLLAEFYHQVSDKFLWGLRYRWVNLDEMDSFSKRSIHTFEVSGGYNF
ncbi:MAG: hypothetical protein CBC16_09430 [Verrucomicrobia bacterium TMED56]|jgi:hypothetical protein|nr:MAG: hypothetical protein CBC16_09430 [Verrucomicrobia bacterium TMED56]